MKRINTCLWRDRMGWIRLGRSGGRGDCNGVYYVRKTSIFNRKDKRRLSTAFSKI